MKNFTLGASKDTAPLLQISAPHISEISRARKLKFCTHLDRAKCTFLDIKKSARGRLRCKYGTPHILETVRARMLKFSTHLDTAKYCFRVSQFSPRGVCGAADREASLQCKFEIPVISRQLLELKN